jgi:hypothetical protein
VAGVIALPKPCVAGSNPAGGTTTDQERAVLTSINAGKYRSCVLSLSAAVWPHLLSFRETIAKR